MNARPRRTESLAFAADWARMGQPGRRRAPRILVAEDDKPFRTLLVSLLREDGYDVVEASDGAQLLDRLADAALPNERADTPLDLVITDLNMPGMSGLDALSYLRAGPWAALPVIVMTAFGDEILHAEARRLGAVLTLDKPFPPDQLRRRVRTLLG